jgi:hypothetical protein
LVERVRHALREDYWALPAPGFPYSVALFDALSRPIVRLRLLKALGRSRALLADEDVRVALRALLESFVDSARTVGMAPVVLFMPDKPGHRDAFDDLLPQLRAQFGGRAVITAVRDKGYRWDQYLPNPNCHPGPYGYRMIAEHAARAVREADARSRAESLGS